VALTVTFTVCDAQQVGFSPSGSFVSPLKNLAFLRTVRPDQKTPPVLAPLTISTQTFVSRKQGSGTPRYFDGSKCFRYALISSSAWLLTLCSQSNTGGNTRGPPFMDPPILC
jgi:hypothetical protein